MEYKLKIRVSMKPRISACYDGGMAEVTLSAKNQIVLRVKPAKLLGKSPGTNSFCWSAEKRFWFYRNLNPISPSCCAD
jgi:hypothetical protein